VGFFFEWKYDSGNWFRSRGNEDREFGPGGLMHPRFACVNDLPISGADPKFAGHTGERAELIMSNQEGELL
jgi:nuclear transport factor 2 (NTF2) superfamily protein